MHHHGKKQVCRQASRVTYADIRSVPSFGNILRVLVFDIGQDIKDIDGLARHQIF